MSFRKTIDAEIRRNVSRTALKRKFRQASAESTGAVVRADDGSDFTMKNGYLYTVVRAITARVNQNFDGWPSEELKAAAHTFVGKPVFVNHQNSDPKKARGRVVASRYFENGADKGIECIMEVDAERFPKLAHEIRTGGLDSVSMGAEAGFTICSMCDNKAVDTADMCDHVRFHKGEHLLKNGKRQLVYETCHKLGFFELSYVFDPADETAVVSKVIQASTTPRTAAMSESERFAALLRQADESPVNTTIADSPFEPLNINPSVPSLVGTDGLNTGGTSTSQYGKSFNALGDSMEGTGGATASGAPSGLAGVSQEDIVGPESFAQWSTDQVTPGGMKSPGEAAPGELTAPPVDLMHNDVNTLINGPAPSGGGPVMASILAAIKQSYGEIEAPESIDTLRPDEPGSEEDFHSPVLPPKELRDPNLDRTQQLDREQEAEGLDGDRRVEDIEGWEAPDHALNEQQAQQQGYQRPEEEFLMAMLSYPTPANSGGSQMNEGRTREDNTMGRSRNSLASRGKVATAGRQTHRKQAEGPLTDGGDQSVNAQSTREPDEAEFITQTPPEEPVEVADGGPISNTESNLVASMQAKQQELLRDAARYQQLQAQKAAKAQGQKAASNPRVAAIAQKIAWMENRLGRKLTAEESATVATSVPETATSVSPQLSGTDDQSLKSPSEPADPNKGVRETQPQDSKQSAKIWAAFDGYLKQKTGKTAREHGFARQPEILRTAKRFAEANQFHPDAYFPHLGNVLSQMKSDEMQRRANMQRRADTSLEVAAPGGRLDVEAPTSNTTDAEAQASQFATDAFGRNAGDGIADPDLSTDYVTWAPGEGKKEGTFRRASTADAVRCADLFVEAGLRPAEDRYNLIAQNENMRAGQVADRIAMCEGFIAVRQSDAQHYANRQRLAASGVSRGSARQVPPGFGGTGQLSRTATRHTSALEDRSTDGLMFM